MPDLCFAIQGSTSNLVQQLQPITWNHLGLIQGWQYSNTCFALSVCPNVGIFVIEEFESAILCVHSKIGQVISCEFVGAVVYMVHCNE